MFEKVLVCLDKSPEAEEILPYIYKEASHFDKIVFLNVVHIPVLNLPVSTPGEAAVPVQTGRMLEGFKKALEETPAYLEEKAQPLKDIGIDVETVVLEGIPSETIIEYIRDNEVTLLAIATHGHSGFREIAREYAEYLLRNAGIPLVLITPKKRKKGKK